MWLAIWGCFAVFIMVFVGWTLVVLLQQKKAWAGFAKKHNLKYQPGTLMTSPVVTGEIGSWKISLYSGVQQTEDVRGQRFVTVLEFQMGRGMPTGGAIATKEFSGFIDSLIFDKTYKPELAEWDKSYVARTRSRKNLQAYLSKERLQLLHGLFAMKNSAVLFFFDEIEAVLRIETSDPLRDETHLNKIVQRVMTTVERLTPTEEEKKVFRQLFLDEKKRRESGLDEDDDGPVPEFTEKPVQPAAKPEPAPQPAAEPAPAAKEEAHKPHLKEKKPKKPKK